MINLSSFNSALSALLGKCAFFSLWDLPGKLELVDASVECVVGELCELEFGYASASEKLKKRCFCLILLVSFVFTLVLD